MDSATVDTAPQPVADPVGLPDVQPAQTSPTLEQHGEQTAPAPTSGEQPVQPETSTQQEQQFDLDEFIRIREQNEQYQKDLQEREGLIAEIQRMAEEQKAIHANQQLRGEVQQEIASLLQDQGIDESIINSLTEKVFGRLDSTRTSYQQQMTEYQQQVMSSYEEALWAASKDGYADFMIKDYGLDPVYLPRLKQAESEKQMTLMAAAFRDAQSYYKQQALDRTVQQQEQQRRASGVDAMAGTNSGPLASEPLKPGKNLDVLSTILSGAV